MAKNTNSKAEPQVTLEEYIGEILPDSEFETDEERIAALIERDRSFAEYQRRLAEFARTYPEVFEKLSQMMSGEISPQAFFADTYPDGESYQAFLDEAQDRDVQEITALRKQTAAERQQKQQNFNAVIDGWVKKRKISPEMYGKLDELIRTFLAAFMDGELTEQELDQFYGILTKDDDLAAAKAQGLKQRGAAQQAAAAAGKGAGNAGLPPNAAAGNGARGGSNPQQPDYNQLPDYMYD